MNTLRYFILSLCLILPSLPSFAAEADTVTAVNINTADAETLSQALKGIGLSKARAIVAYRKNYGNFKSIDELVEVKGIGSSLIDRNRKRIVLQ